MQKSCRSYAKLSDYKLLALSREEFDSISEQTSCKTRQTSPTFKQTKPAQKRWQPLFRFMSITPTKSYSSRRNTPIRTTLTRLELDKPPAAS